MSIYILRTEHWNVENAPKLRSLEVATQPVWWEVLSTVAKYRSLFLSELYTTIIFTSHRSLSFSSTEVHANLAHFSQDKEAFIFNCGFQKKT